MAKEWYQPWQTGQSYEDKFQENEAQASLAWMQDDIDTYKLLTEDHWKELVCLWQLRHESRIGRFWVPMDVKRPHPTEEDISTGSIG